MPKPPTPPSLGRQEEGHPSGAAFYGQVMGASIAPVSQGGGSMPAGWHTPLGPDWAPGESKQWHAPLQAGVSLYSHTELGAGSDQIELLREVYGMVLDASGGYPYAVFGNHGWEYRTDPYLSQRDSFFGSATLYAEYERAAIAELEADGGKLRGNIEPNKAVRAHRPRWKEAQGVFYAWTRKAYERELGAGADIPKVINANQSPALRAALKRVRADYKHPFREEGFNPRPIKTTKGYRLGTLSDHAVGMAVDINTATNAQIETKDWQTILDFTGKSLDATTRESQWKTAPQQLHTAIKEINDLFVQKLNDAIAAKEATGLQRTAAFDAVLKEDTHLKKLNVKFVKRWQGGFFDLPWDLVKELHEEKLIWGAIFKRVDLHHFEL